MTAKEVSKLSGVSVRTLHHYDEIGLLVPNRDISNNYRVYDDENLNRLQQILFFKECGFPLLKIQEIMQDTSYNKEDAFLLQKEILLKEKTRIEKMINVLDNSLEALKGELVMSNEEKFSALKEAHIVETKKIFGDEIRKKYGDNIIEKSNNYYKNMPKDKFVRLESLDKIILKLLDSLLQDPNNNELLERLANSHKEWLKISWGNAVKYSRETHLNLCDMYLSDKRFLDYYGGKDNAIILKKAVEIFG